MSWHIDHPPSATDPQFTSQYATLLADQRWLPASAFNSSAASRTITVGRWDSWLLAADEVMMCDFQFPSDWSEYYLDVYWANPSSGSGNVSWTHTRDVAATGETLNASGDTTTRVTVAAAGQYLLSRTRLTATATALDAADLSNLRITRISTLDTLTGDIVFLGARVGKA